MLGSTVYGFARYAAAYCILGAGLWYTQRSGRWSGQGQVRLAFLMLLAPTLTSLVGLGGEALLTRANLLSGHAPLDPAGSILLTAAVVLTGMVLLVDRLTDTPPAPGGPPGSVPLVIANVLDLFVILGAVAVAAWFRREGVIPMFAGARGDEVRFAIVARDTGLYSRFIYVSSVALAVRLACWAARLEPWSRFRALPTALVCTPTVIALVLFGSKYLYVFPALVAFLTWNRYRSNVRLLRPRNVVIAVAAIYALVIVTNIRGLGRLISNSLLLDLFIMVPEFRDMAATVAIAEDLGLTVNPFGFLLSAAVPSEVAGAFGIVQKADPAEIAFVYKNLLGYTFAGGSVRIGMLGEMFVSARWLGVVIGCGVLGGLIMTMDRVIRHAVCPTLRSVIAIAAGVQLLWHFQAEVPTMLPITYLFAYFFAGLLILERIARPASPSAAP